MRAAPHLDPTGVSGHQPDRRHLHLQGVGDDLDEGRLMALARRLGAGQHLHGAILRNRDRQTLTHRANGRFHIVGDADAAKLPARLAV